MSVIFICIFGQKLWEKKEPIQTELFSVSCTSLMFSLNTSLYMWCRNDHFSNESCN